MRANRRKQSSRCRRKGNRYTKGELNRLIDGVCHPLCKSDKRFLLLDGFLHALVEQNPPVSLGKFLKYNLQAILGELENGR